MESTYKNAFEQIVSFLENLEEKKGIKYYFIGGLLVNLYSDLRITTDIDVAIDFYSSQISIKDYIDFLADNNFYPFQDWSTTLILARENNVIQFLDKSETIRYDNHIILRIRGDKYKKIGPIALERRNRKKVFGTECWVASKEDFILSKLVFGGWQDYTDALGCWMRFKKELDQNYLSKMSKELVIQKEYALLIPWIFV